MKKGFFVLMVLFLSFGFVFTVGEEVFAKPDLEQADVYAKYPNPRNSWDFKPRAKVNGTYSSFAFVGGRDYQKPMFVDIDADGDKDMFIMYEAYQGHTNAIFMENMGSDNQPSWKFKTDMYLPEPPAATSYYGGGITFVDIDSDGDFDMLVGGGSGREYIFYYRNDGTPQIPDWNLVDPYYFFGLGKTPTFVDIDNDGDFDMFSGRGNGKIVFVRNDGDVFNPEWTVVTTEYASIDVGTYAAPTFVDIDNDSDYDLFVGSRYDDIYFYRNDGTAGNPVWTFVTSEYNTIDNQIHTFPVFVDIDNDSDFDMFVGTARDSINFYENTGSPTIPSWNLDNSSYTTIDVGKRSCPALADIDADNDYDLFIGNINRDITYYRNDGTNRSPDWVFVTDDYVDPDYGEAPTFVDIDGDGDLDLFSDGYSGGISFYRNDGTPESPLLTFITYSYNDISTGASTNFPTFFDIDNDNDFDLFVSGHNGVEVIKVLFYRNDGDAFEPIWTLVTEHYVDEGSGRLTFFDIDKDGDFDLFCGKTYYRNDGTSEEPEYRLITTNYNGLDKWKGRYHFWGGFSFLDIDDNGKDDLFVGAQLGGLYYYKNYLSHFGPIYVDVDNINDRWENGTQQHPFDRIQEGVDFSVSQEVIVAQGTYQENVVLGDGVQLRGTGGGFLTPQDPSDDTVIDAVGGDFGIEIRNLGGAVINGFSITQAQKSGLSSEDRSENISIKNCRFFNNEGAGAIIRGTSPVKIENTILEDHTAGGYSALLIESGTDVVIKNCLLRNNTASYTMYLANGATATIMNTTFDSNNGTALRVPNTTVSLYDSVITNSGGYGISWWDDPFPGTITHCDVWNNASGNYDGDDQTGLNENISEDPLFVSGDKGDHYLSQIQAGQPEDSPCVDTGSEPVENLGMDAYTTRTDHEGDSDIVDMGFHYSIP